MSKEPAPATWFPDGKVNALLVCDLSAALLNAARAAGYSRETYACAVAQMAESLCGFDGDEDIDPEVFRFIQERLSLTAEAMRESGN